MSVRVLVGDCRELMAEMEDASVDSVVCDPPYELGFMGKGWDKTGIAYDPAVWSEALRVLKPGGHLVAFSGTRTYHRMAVAIEDAGFEIRDQLAWVYGSGFPKSLDVSKALDKAAGAEHTKKRFDVSQVGNFKARQDTRPWIEEAKAKSYHEVDSDEPATEAAKQWQGWGTALKPAWEPICLARKPLAEPTVAANVLKWGTGAINVDGCRIAHNEECRIMAPSQANIDNPSEKVKQAGRRVQTLELKPTGRWPANIMHDGSDEVLAAFPETSSGVPGTRRKAHETGSMSGRLGLLGRQESGFGDSGSAARFFYCAKTSKRERGEGNDHPTVKPRAVMAWLARLVTPPGGLVLDPFTGSGSTALAAMEEGFRFVGCELSPEYAAIAERRVAAFALELEERARSKVPDLFD